MCLLVSHNVKQVTPGAGPFLTQGYNVKNLCKGPLDTKVLNVKGLGLLVSHKKISKVFPHKSLCKTSDPLDGAILTQGHTLKNHGKDPLYQAIYQISKVWAF